MNWQHIFTPGKTILVSMKLVLFRLVFTLFEMVAHYIGADVEEFKWLNNNDESRGKYLAFPLGEISIPNSLLFSIFTHPI